LVSQVIELPQYNVSDDDYILIEKLLDNGAYVKVGQEIAVFEGSKAAYDVESPFEGYISFDAAEGDVVKVNTGFAQIFNNLEDAKKQNLSENNVALSSVNISLKAEKLISENNIDPAVFVGKDIIRHSDVEKYISETQNFDTDVEISDESLIIFGIGSQADVALDAVAEIGEFALAAYVDYKQSQTKKNNLPVISHQNFLKIINSNAVAVYVCLPDRKLERQIFKEVRASRSHLVTIISKTAVISPRAEIGNNVFIGPHCTVGPFAKLSDGVRMLNGSSVAHHATVEENSWISDGARIGGSVVIGADCLIGLNSSVNKHVKIGSKCIVNSNTGVSENQNDGTFVR